MTAKLSQQDLDSIAANASGLWDRRGNRSEAAIRAAESQTVEARLREWKKVAADADEDAFKRRLDFDGYQIDDARRVLAGNPTPPGLPSWTGVLGEMLRKAADLRERLTGPAESARFGYLRAGAPVPFEELLVPLVEAARDRLVDVTRGCYGRVAPDGQADFERSLLKRLSELAARALLVEFRTFRACAQLSTSLAGDGHAGTQGRATYLRFVKHALDGGLADLFREYPVLARLLATVLMNWVDATAEFLRRFEQDSREIQRYFLADGDDAEISRVQPGLSDWHDGGRAVVALAFRSGARIVYKPKSLALEGGYFGLLDWLNEQGRLLAFAHPKILNCGDYGWMEFVERRQCATEDEARRFHRRLGMFLCLVYVLNGIDFHFENIFRCGEHPIPVDLETIYHHVPEALAEDGDPITRRLKDSVLRADILPNPVKLHDRYYDISAIGQSLEEGRALHHLRWKNVNTDGMSFSAGASPGRAAERVQAADDRAAGADAYVGEIEQGFCEMYRCLLAQRETLLEADSPLRQMFRFPARYLFRTTAFYHSILNAALHPDHLRNGIDFAIQLDVLSRRLLKSDEKPHSWPLVSAEAEALLQADVPKFSARGDDTRLTLRSGTVVRHCFPRSAWEAVERKIRGLSEEDLAWQVKLIGASMEAHAMQGADMSPPASESAPPWSRRPVVPLGTDALRQCALDVARQIAASAVYGDNGEPSWLVLNYVPEANQFMLQTVSLDLYNGRCGIALFFAALERCVAALGYRALAYSTLAPVRRWLAAAGPKEVGQMGLGGLIGLPSLIYSLTRISEFLGDAELAAEAGRATALVDPICISADKKLDVVGGAAGAILCLLACHETMGGARDALDKAIACGRHLLARREIDKCGARTWATFASRHLTGFSHGAAGIAYALLRLFGKTAEPEFLAAAKEAIDFESTEFVPEHNNWPDRRPENGEEAAARPRFKVAWCNGAPGIGLARLGGLHVFDSPAVRRDIDAAIAATNASPLLERDHICCGNLGLAETLLKAGMALESQECVDQCVRLVSQVAGRARLNGSFSVTSPRGFFNPALFQGAAGIGYEFLRVACPDRIPSVLMLE